MIMKLDFDNLDVSMENFQCSPVTPHTPKFNCVRSLNLCDSPATPKTIIQKCPADSTSKDSVIRNKRLHASRFRETNPLRVSPECKRKKSRKSNNNPYTPISLNKYYEQKDSKTAYSNKKRVSIFNCEETVINESRIDSSFEDTADIDSHLRDRLSIHEANVSRYFEEFLEIDEIGKGQFGCVLKCKHRLDGIIYAIKKSLKPVAGSAGERKALQEVYAHAVLGNNSNVVKYYNAWAEDDHMLIQSEYCNGGSLAALIEKKKKNGECFTEEKLTQILLQVSNGLKYIHSHYLVHLDIKPENIFLVHVPKIVPTNDVLSDENETEDIQYKIGDLGHVTSMNTPVVYEGDCRYLPRDLLEEGYSVQATCDIFSLGMTVYEAATLNMLPKNGDDWHEIRDGVISGIDHLSNDFQLLLKTMLASDSRERPSAVQIINHLTTNNILMKSKNQLLRELQAEKTKNALLEQRLIETEKCLESMSAKKSKKKNHLPRSNLPIRSPRITRRTRKNASLYY